MDGLQLGEFPEVRVRPVDVLIVREMRAAILRRPVEGRRQMKERGSEQVGGETEAGEPYEDKAETPRYLLPAEARLTQRAGPDGPRAQHSRSPLG